MDKQHIIPSEYGPAASVGYERTAKPTDFENLQRERLTLPETLKLAGLKESDFDEARERQLLPDPVGYKMSGFVNPQRVVLYDKGAVLVRLARFRAFASKVVAATRGR